MATPTVLSGSRNPFDNLANAGSSTPFQLDIADYIDFLAPERDVPFLRTLGWGASAQEIASAQMGSDSLSRPCTSYQHSWLNDTLVPSSGVTTAGHTAGGASITVSAAASLYFRVNDIVRVHSSTTTVTEVNKDVMYIITAINTGTGVLTVTVLNTDQDFVSGDPWYLMGNAQTVGASANTTGKTTILTQTNNFTQIMMDDAVVTGTEQSIEQYGIDNPLAREVDKTFQRLMVQFERAVTFGLRSTSLPGSSATASRMGGFFYFTRVTSDGLSSDLAGDPISQKAIDDIAATLWNAGGTPSVIMTNLVGLREIQKFNQSMIRVDKGSDEARKSGLFVDSIETVSGLAFDVVLNRHVGNGDFLFLSPEMLGVGPLSGNGNSRAFKAAEIPWNGTDNRRVHVHGEYTMEVKNHPTHHYWLYGGASSVSS